MTSVAEAINQARLAVDIDRHGKDWIVRHINGKTIFNGPTMDFFRARDQCRRARIEYALSLLGWSEMEAQRAAYVADGKGRFEDAVREAAKFSTHKES